MQPTHCVGNTVLRIVFMLKKERSVMWSINFLFSGCPMNQYYIQLRLCQRVLAGLNTAILLVISVHFLVKFSFAKNPNKSV